MAAFVSSLTLRGWHMKLWVRCGVSHQPCSSLRQADESRGVHMQSDGKRKQKYSMQGERKAERAG